VDLKKLIRDIPDFPKKGIVFKDITPLLRDPAGFKACVQRLTEIVKESSCDLIAAIESRGFPFGAAVALELGLGLVPIRKPGKLPYSTISQTYDLEYGTDSVEIHTDAVQKGQKVAIIDDLLATGGTMAASCRLVDSLGGSVSVCLFVVELSFLEGQSKLAGRNIRSLISY